MISYRAGQFHPMILLWHDSLFRCEGLYFLRFFHNGIIDLPLHEVWMSSCRSLRREGTPCRGQSAAGKYDMAACNSAGQKKSTGGSHYAVFFLVLLLFSSAAASEAGAGAAIFPGHLDGRGVPGAVMHLFNGDSKSILPLRTCSSHSAAFFFRHKARRSEPERFETLTEILECAFTPLYYCFSYPGMSLVTFAGVALLLGLSHYLASRLPYRKVRGRKRRREFSVET